MGRAVSELLCLGRKGRANLNFPNRLSSWEGLGATLSLGYESISLSVQGKELSAHSTGFALAVISSVHLPFRWSTAGLLDVPARPSGQVWLGDTLLSEWDSDSALCLDLNQADLHLTKFLGQSVPLTWFSR